MRNVSFALQTSDYSTARLYRLTDYNQKILGQMFTAILNKEAIRMS